MEAKILYLNISTIFLDYWSSNKVNYLELSIFEGEGFVIEFKVSAIAYHWSLKTRNLLNDSLKQY